jgi:cytochrome c553
MGDPLVHIPMLAGQRPEAIFLALREYRSGARKSDIMAAIVALLSDQDMRDLGAYLAAQGPQMPPVHSVGSWAHEKVHRDCTACHGESGMGVMPGVPVITGQHQDYLIDALVAYQDGRRTNRTMAPIAAKLTTEEIQKLAEYFALSKHLEISK